MKRMSRISCTLALLLMSLGAVPSANAVGLLGFGPPPATFTNSAGVAVTVPGLPAWFQDQNGVAVQPCLDVAACGLVARAPVAAVVGPPAIPADPGFNPGVALTFPNNFPDEFFYFASAASFPVGPFSAVINSNLEVVFQDALGNLVPPTTPGAVAVPFQRLRFEYTYLGLGGNGAIPAAAVGGNFTVTTPWGEATFSATDPAMFNPAPGKGCGTAFNVRDTKCVLTRDLFSVPPLFTPALGNGTVAFGNAISGFLQDPTAASGLLGNAGAALSFTGAPVGRLNQFSVTDPLGNTGSTTQLLGLTGKKFGMEVAPLLFDFGAFPITTPVTNSPVKTITVTNINTANPLVLGPLALTGTNLADFAIVTDACSNTTLPAALPAPAAPSNCTFTVAFAPKPLAPAPEVGLRTAKVSIPGTFAGVAAPTGLAALSGTAQYTMAASAGANGAILPIGAAIIVNAGATQNFTITPNAKFQIKDITVNGALATFTKPAKLGAPVVFTSPAATTIGTTVNATFMPSGDLDGDGILNIKDALKALKILVALQAPVGNDLVAMKVAPLDATGRPGGSGAPDLIDVLLILRRALGVITW